MQHSDNNDPALSCWESRYQFS